MPLHQRPQLTAAFDTAAGISQYISLPIDDVFVEKATWCMIRLFLRWDGGTEYSWGNWRTILCWCIGIDLLAFSTSLALATVISGFLASDQYGRSLRFHNSSSSNTCLRIVSVIFMGTGIGLSGQQTPIAVQTVFEGRDVAPATSPLIALQSLVSTVFLAVIQDIFHSRLMFALHRNVPSVDSVLTVDSSKIVGSMRRIYPNFVDGIIKFHNTASTALRDVFLIATVLGCLTIFGCVFIEWKSVKRKEP
ncbi:AflT/aflT/transmembrane protein [Colletotrichum higginsianum IMI 349063]|uniref:AflT/aflT/transmembrane protein n=1 Tax=Colletotrichum higginsianum (strain IMI 349063) TaxID=759273 RepID=A0A1B7XSA9_COLHI|nr:AflT/aflT/transmembrane protein [Colletotrichum higginsianum IMI 349063]OBR02652.1 AflT/aflT/transmembrane protein [Colletotrichum higginsianum IMI 349063]